MEIKLEAPKEVIVRDPIIVTAASIFINQVTDNYSDVTALVTFKGEKRDTGRDPITKTLVLWEGDAYLKIGQWTDDDVEKRILELLNQ